MGNFTPERMQRIADRLDQLSNAVTNGRAAMDGEFTMRVPAEPDRDADLVLSDAAEYIRATLRQQAGRVDEGMVERALTAWNQSAFTGGAALRDRLREVLTAALAQNTQVGGEAVGFVMDDTAVGRKYGVLTDESVPNGAKLYLHAERARVPDGMVLVGKMIDGPYTIAEWNDAGHALPVGTRLFAAPSQPKDAGEVELRARRLYAKWTDNQGIHSNRFPGWLELSDAERDKWRTKATTQHEDAE